MSNYTQLNNCLHVEYITPITCFKDSEWLKYMKVISFIAPEIDIPYKNYYRSQNKFQFVVAWTACPFFLNQGDRVRQNVVVVIGYRVPISIAGGRLRQSVLKKSIKSLKFLKILPLLHVLGKNQHNWRFCSHIVSSKANDKLVQSLSEIENAKTSSKNRKIASLKIDPIKLRIS